MGSPVASEMAERMRVKPDDDDRTILSKKLSYVLRHGASALGLEINDSGYVSVQELLACEALFEGVAMEALLDVVRQSNEDKLRYELVQEAEGDWLIRAANKHTISGLEKPKANDRRAPRVSRGGAGGGHQGHGGGSADRGRAPPQMSEDEFCTRWRLDRLARARLGEMPPANRQLAMQRFRPGPHVPSSDFPKVFVAFCRRFCEKDRDGTEFTEEPAPRQKADGKGRQEKKPKKPRGGGGEPDDGAPDPGRGEGEDPKAAAAEAAAEAQPQPAGGGPEGGAWRGRAAGALRLGPPPEDHGAQYTAYPSPGCSPGASPGCSPDASPRWAPRGGPPRGGLPLQQAAPPRGGDLAGPSSMRALRDLHPGGGVGAPGAPPPQASPQLLGGPARPSPAPPPPAYAPRGVPAMQPGAGFHHHAAPALQHGGCQQQLPVAPPPPSHSPQVPGMGLGAPPRGASGGWRPSRGTAPQACAPAAARPEQEANDGYSWASCAWGYPGDYDGYSQDAVGGSPWGHHGWQQHGHGGSCAGGGYAGGGYSGGKGQWAQPKAHRGGDAAYHGAGAGWESHAGGRGPPPGASWR